MRKKLLHSRSGEATLSLDEAAEELYSRLYEEQALEIGSVHHYNQIKERLLAWLADIVPEVATAYEAFKASVPMERMDSDELDLDLLDGFLDIGEGPGASPQEKKRRAMEPVDYIPERVKMQLRTAALSSLRLPDAGHDEVAAAVALMTSPAERRQFPILEALCGSEVFQMRVATTKSMLSAQAELANWLQGGRGA